ncbi:MAG: DUF429 domain-containing protein [Pseudomonadota bacterium]
MPPERDQLWIAGLDGAPGGWIAVLHPLEQPDAARSILLRSLEELGALEEKPAVVAIDIPIGLPDHAGPGGRGCDVAARAVLGARQSSIFTVPARAAVMTEDYRAACEVAAAHSTPSRKVSKQCFFLFPKIREADAYLARHGLDALHECHPEVAFWAMNGCEALSEAKKVKSRPSEPGLELRRRLLEREGYTRAFLENLPYLRKDVAPDDLLDACAAAWTAVRIARGEALRFPTGGGVDDRGVPMVISA